MKIKIVYYIYPYILGGAEQLLSSLIQHLDRRRFEPVVASFDSGRWVARFRSLGIQTVVLPSSKYIPERWVKFLRETKADMVQSNSYSPTMALAARKLQMPHIWRLGGHVKIIGGELKARQREDYLHLIGCLSTRIVCPSKFIKSQFQKLNFSDVRVIPNGVDTTQIDKIIAGRQPGNGAGALKGYFSAAMVGHLHPQKRHFDFIEAARRIKKEYSKSKFFVFGGVCREYRENPGYARELLRKVREAGLDKDFLFTESYQHLLKRILEMNVVVLPSVSEGASVAILEAMALGKPVVASSSGGNPEFIKDRVTGLLVPPKNPQRLAEALLSLLKDKKKAEEMGKRGRERVKRLFDIKTSVRRYESLYQGVLPYRL